MIPKIKEVQITCPNCNAEFSSDEGYYYSHDRDRWIMVCPACDYYEVVHPEV